MKKCLLCGTRYVECKHHLIFGNSRRSLADADRLVIDICNECHNMAVKPMDRIHGNSQAERLSKMLGQALWERNFIDRAFIEIKGDTARIDAREAFLKRYGRSYLE